MARREQTSTGTAGTSARGEQGSLTGNASWPSEGIGLLEKGLGCTLA